MLVYLYRILKYADLRRCGKKFKKFHHVNCKILSFRVTKILLEALPKKWADTLHKVSFVCKNLYNGGASLIINYSRQVGYMIEKI